jgi:hypothetical protein
MSCPNIYLGPSITQAPPSPYWTNPAIDVASVEFPVGEPTSVSVIARNHGTDNSPLSRIELFWSDPAASFAAVPTRRIGYFDLNVVGATVSGGGTIDVDTTHAFAWTPPDEAAINDGHVCLLARITNLMSPGNGCMNQSYLEATPWQDARSAIRNIHVYHAVKAEKMMAFGFASENTLLDGKATELTARPLDPQNDRKRLEQLLTDRALRKALTARRLKFAVPNDVLIAEGRGRVLLTKQLLARKDASAMMYVGKLGEVSAEYVDKLVAPGRKLAVAKQPYRLDLTPGERVQSFVQIETTGRDDVVYAVDIEQRSEDGVSIGGLTVFFVPANDFF